MVRDEEKQKKKVNCGFHEPAAAVIDLSVFRQHDPSWTRSLLLLTLVIKRHSTPS